MGKPDHETGVRTRLETGLIVMIKTMGARLLERVAEFSLLCRVLTV